MKIHEVSWIQYITSTLFHFIPTQLQIASSRSRLLMSGLPSSMYRVQVSLVLYFSTSFFFEQNRLRQNQKSVRLIAMDTENRV